MKINIICIGKLQKEWLSLSKDYINKISYFSKVNVLELKEVKHPSIDALIKKETENIINAIPKNSKVILCSLKGKQYSSEQFANIINEDNITFVIGGSHGVDESMFKEKISFSKMTFNHQMFRIFLLEQIYRSFTIKNNIKYHK